MERAAPTVPPSRREARLLFVLFLLCLAFNFWGVHVGWQSKNLPGNEFRQSQTALSAYWIKEENNFSLAYPTPVVGRPWSVPMEFPFYQWATVLVSNLTHWSLTKSGRAVSIACFYLTLPAIFLLLARWRVAPSRRWLVLAVVLTCPFYIYFARGFLIETMALMFSLWFWVAFERAVAVRSKSWLALAILAGTGAGLVKVTTYLIYLVPAAWWASVRLWARRKEAWWTDFLWMAAAVIVPFTATIWWVHFADAVKLQNTLGREFTSASLRDFNLGTTAAHFSPALWAMKGRIIREQLSWLPVLVLCGLLVPVAARSRWREIAACLVFFSLALVIFPILYAYHEYYYAANTVLLLIAAGLVLAALAESKVARWLVVLAVLLVVGGQVWRYLDYYYPGQRQISPGGDGLTRSLQALTKPDDVIVVLGQDWNSMTPYYARRRGMMIRDSIGRDPARVEQALAALGDVRIGALVIVGHPDGAQGLIDRVWQRGIEREPLYVWRDARVYLPQARHDEMLQALLDNNGFEGVTPAPGVILPQADLAGRWCKLSGIPSWKRGLFFAMNPAPVRFFATFGPALDGSSGEPMFGAHPVTQLVFALPAGRHVLRSSLQMPVDAYRMDLRDSDATDGVEVSLFALGLDGTRHQLATRYFDPRHRQEDRGIRVLLEFTFTLPAAGEVELFFGPGPSGLATRDWIQLGPLKID